jgi:hypothetical protein
MRLPDNGKKVKQLVPRKKESTQPVCARLGINTNGEKPPLLAPVTEKKEPARLAFPYITPPGKTQIKMSLVWCLSVCSAPRIPIREPSPAPQVPSGQPSIMKKRGYEQANGIDGVCFVFDFVHNLLLFRPRCQKANDGRHQTSWQC